MKQLIDKSKGPGVYIPPPFFYVVIFLAAVFLQKQIPIDRTFFHNKIIRVTGIVLLIASLFFLIRSLRQFFLTKNTVILIKPASSLQTTGIYGITRNPMYVGLMLVYFSLSILFGNWWNFILFPILFLIIGNYVIKREEDYLEVEFGHEYREYKKRVRRWL